jgi:DNA polymerase-3 subunit epsilon
LYAILDIETTGGKYNEEGITEIAIYKYDGHTVVDQFITLINPEKPIQEFVVKLTGINNKMLRNAPKFYEVAKRIVEITKDCILVAHNSSFDYRILRTEFARLEYDFFRNSICTVELSRKLIPGLESYSLGKLCKSLGIPMSDRHRASGDALATVQLFKLLLEKDVSKTILEESITYFDKRNEKQKINQILETLPEVMGIFYIHDVNGKIIFVGRSKNIRAEVNKLFLKETKRALKIQTRVHSVSYEETGNLLFNRLKYYLELESLSPKFNFKSKRKMNLEDFASDNFLLIHKGRTVGEHAIILVENNNVYGYGYTNLAFQESQVDILKKLLTPIEQKSLAKTLIKNYLKNNTTAKILRYEA